MEDKKGIPAKKFEEIVGTEREQIEIAYDFVL